jgi:hypothetical protein
MVAVVVVVVGKTRRINNLSINKVALLPFLTTVSFCWKSYCIVSFCVYRRLEITNWIKQQRETTCLQQFQSKSISQNREKSFLLAISPEIYSGA